ncbi:hypothetical protein PV327_009184 [Microctonus hyperodae]|uniref:Peptidoglycan-recognition protein n=1 Tax=Microctonus hyperodae TaxID=165561 RepID=A0AA39KVG2_MICHY|nr:hypothetical protein PV327_009184 [Microctonus hyperodae]
MKLLPSRLHHIQFIFINLFILNIINGVPIKNEDKASLIIDNICPRIINRSEWGAKNATSQYENLKIIPTPYVVIHHGGILHYCYDQNGCSEIVRSYQDLHINKNKWIDIGYNFVIGEDGNVYEGRGWNFRGAHAPGYNTQSIGISIIGDFSHFIPNVGALRALDALIACGVALKKINKNYAVMGHRQGRNTVCPGEVFYNYVKTMPRWTSNPIPVYDSLKPNSTVINHQLQEDIVSNNKIVTVV